CDRGSRNLGMPVPLGDHHSPATALLPHCRDAGMQRGPTQESGQVGHRGVGSRPTIRDKKTREAPETVLFLWISQNKTLIFGKKVLCMHNFFHICGWDMKKNVSSNSIVP